MARIVKTEVDISVGDLGRSSKTRACFDIGTGESYISEHREKLSNIIGQDPEEMKAYVTIPCPSAESSQKFAALLKKALKDAKSNNESTISTLLKMLEDNEGGDDEGDNDEENEAPKAFDFKITTHLNNVIIKIETSAFEEAFEGTLNFVSMQAGEIINFNSNLHVEIDTRRTLHAILSRHFIHALTESILIKVILSYDSRILTKGRRVAQNFDMSKEILRALGYASMYAGGSVNLHFKSADDLDENVKNALGDVVAMVSSVGQMIPPDISELVCGLAENSGHEAFINVLTPIFAGEISLLLRGASEIFQSN